MYSKAILFSAIFCIVKASIIVNVFDDVPETQSTYSLRECNEKECEVICRWLNFPSGVCIDGHCKCNNSHSVDQNEEDKFDPIVPETARSCYYQECDQRCRRLGFTGGACVNGRCKCDNFLSEDKTVEGKFDPIIPETARSCYYQECDQRCRRLGFTGGACVNGRCKCDNFLNEDKTVEDDVNPIASETVRSCYYRECEQRCRRLGFPGDACVNGRCKCDNFLSTEYRDDIPKFNGSFSVNNCYHRQCMFQCRKQGFNGGICIKGNCKCDNYE